MAIGFTTTRKSGIARAIEREREREREKENERHMNTRLD
jgi:hypothetical protein